MGAAAGIGFSETLPKRSASGASAGEGGAGDSTGADVSAYRVRSAYVLGLGVALKYDILRSA